MAMQWHKYLDKDPGHRWFREGLHRLASADGMAAVDAPDSIGLASVA